MRLGVFLVLRVCHANAHFWQVHMQELDWEDFKKTFHKIALVHINTLPCRFQVTTKLCFCPGHFSETIFLSYFYIEIQANVLAGNVCGYDIICDTAKS